MINGRIAPDKFKDTSVEMKLLKASIKYLLENPMVIGFVESIDVGINSSLASPTDAFVVDISMILSFLMESLMIEYVISLSDALSLGDNKDTLSTASTSSSLLNFKTIGKSAGINLDVSG